MTNCGERTVESSRPAELEDEGICFQQYLDLLWEFSVVFQSWMGVYGQICRFQGVQRDREQESCPMSTWCEQTPNET